MKDSLRGLKVRLYEEDDYFWDGRIVRVDLESVDVDYGDWIQRYRRDQLQEIWPDDGTYENVLIPSGLGEVVTDYREPA